MRFIVQTIFIGVVAWALEQVLPWWSIALAAAAGGFLFNARASFLSGFVAIGVLWLTAAWLIDNASSTQLADKIATIMGVDTIALFLLTCALGALVGGFAAMTGASVRKEKKKRRGYY